MKILIVDTSNLYFSVIAQKFPAISSGIESTADPVVAQEMITTGQFDFVCVSYQLQQCTGIEFAKAIRQLEQGKHLPIILLTSNDPKDIYMQALASGITEVFSKSKINQLLNFVGRFLEFNEPILGKVLYIEDSAAQRLATTRLMEDKGIEVDSYSNAEDALRNYEQGEYDLIVTDVVLEGQMTGMELTNHIRRLDGPKGDVPILALTGFDDISRRVELFSLGVNDYVIKPIIEKELLTRIRNLIQGKKLHEELAIQRGLAENANQVKSQFLANMSHEIRTPMNAIIGMNRLALENQQNAELCTRYLNTALSSSEDLLAIINDILDFSKIESGALVVEQVDFNLKDVIKKVFDLLKDTAHDRNISMRLKVDKRVPKRLIADPTRLRQVLLNLLSNAIKFSDDGKAVLLEIQAEEQNKGAVKVSFAVTDEGIGISPELQPQIFESFTQADPSITRKFGGTGLGLLISKRLTERMGGEISVESELGKGSTFRFSITAALGLDRIEETPGVAQQAVNDNIEGTRILLVEDNPINQQLALALLQSQGCNVELAENGQEAVAKVQQADFDCVLMDFQMPVMDGIEATRAIRGLGTFDTLPIIAMTANAMKEDRERALGCGMNDYVSKPIDPPTLYRTIAQHLG